MRIRPVQAVLVFLLGAAAGVLGDTGHVLSGTTRYQHTGTLFGSPMPFIWESPLWFPLAIGLATVALTELSLRGRQPDGDADWSDAAAIVATATQVQIAGFSTNAPTTYTSVAAITRMISGNRYVSVSLDTGYLTLLLNVLGRR